MLAGGFVLIFAGLGVLRPCAGSSRHGYVDVLPLARRSDCVMFHALPGSSTMRNTADI